MENLRILNNELKHFNGSDTIYRHRSQLLFSEGVHFLRETFEAFWLIDAILFNEFDINPMFEQEFYVFILERIFVKEKPTNKFYLRLEDGNKNELGRVIIPFSDFKADKLTLYFENDTLYLPSER